MAWEIPKINWHSSYDDDGNYTGDHFNASDFNRIKNNLEYLQELASEMHDEFSIVSLGADRTPMDYFYADEINQLEENLVIVNTKSLNCSYGVAPIYSDNGRIMDFSELNRLESAILDLYNRFTNEHDGRRMLTLNFGMKGVDL